MVFNGSVVVAVAELSATFCQYIAFNPERLSSDEVLRLICCLPLHQLGRFALCLCSFFCLPTNDPYHFLYHHRPRRFLSSSSSSSSSDDSDYPDYDPHSD